MEIAVIGAGLIGLTAAHRLLVEGHAVTVIAPPEAPTMASTGNAGTVADYAIDPVGTPEVLRDLPRLLFDRTSPLAIHRPSSLTLTPWLARFLIQSRPAAAHRNRLALAALLRDAAAGWRELAASVRASDLIRDRGALYGYDNPRAVAAARAGLDRRSALGVGVEILDADALQALEPALPAGRFAGAALFPGALWFADPAAMLARIADACAAQRVSASVRDLHPRGAGWRLTLDNGATVGSQAVVVAAGAWSARLLRPLGVRVPLDTERGYHLEYDLPDSPLTRPLCPVTRGFYMVPMAGRLRVAGTVELGGIDAPPSVHRWDLLDTGARSVFPALPPPARRWMGLRPSMPDSLPVIGEARPGLILAFGHGHIGLTLAPHTAALVARAVAGLATPDAVHPDRF